MKIRKFLHHFGMHSIYWSSVRGDEKSTVIERKCRYCNWHDRIEQ
jgi:hypothetical protein